MSYELKTNYGGANLELSFGPTASATLRINGVERDSATREPNGPNSQKVTLMLSSSVQTDYEWHEFVEAIVRYDTSTIEASLLANKQELVSRSISREEL